MIIHETDLHIFEGFYETKSDGLGLYTFTKSEYKGVKGGVGSKIHCFARVILNIKLRETHVTFNSNSRLQTFIGSNHLTDYMNANWSPHEITYLAGSKAKIVEIYNAFVNSSGQPIEI